MRVMAEASHIFNPIFLARQSDADIVTVLQHLAGNITNFNFRHFDGKFIKMLKQEMSALVKETNGDHRLERFSSTRQY